MLRLLAAFLAAFVAVGMVASCKNMLIHSPGPPAVATRVQGPGINCHGEKLPVKALRSIGIRWVRLDVESERLSPKLLSELVFHYKGLGQLWIIRQDCPDVDSFVNDLVALGVTDFELYNEPNLADVGPHEYTELFKKTKAHLRGRGYLYGPCISAWGDFVYYLQACIKLGLRPDVLSIHAYEDSPENALDAILEAEGYGYPVVISEMGYPDSLGGTPYRTALPNQPSIPELYLESRSLLDGRTWCWYDGPNPVDNLGTGLFDFDGKNWTIPNHNFLIIQREVRRELGRLNSSLKKRLTQKESMR